MVSIHISRTSIDTPTSAVAAMEETVGGYSSDSSNEPIDVTNLDPATLKARILAQVEFYFSPQNLNKDVYMLSQMDSEGFIAITTISQFKKLKRLTEDVGLIVESVADSTICELSEDKAMLRSRTALRRQPRTTIILRDVPKETVESDIKALFDESEFVSAHSDVGDTWFVMMSSEDGAKNAVLHLLGKTLHGAPVKARLKSATLRPTQTFPQAAGAAAAGAVPPAAPVAAGGPAAAAAAAAQFGYAGNPYYGYPQQAGWPGMAGAYQTGNTGVTPGQGGLPAQSLQQQAGGQQTRRQDGKGRKGSDRGQSDGSKRSTGPGGKGLNRRGDRHSSSGPSGSGSQRKKKTGGPGSAAGGPNNKRQAAKAPVFQATDFPSLPLGKSGSENDEQQESAFEEIVQESATTSSTSASAHGTTITTNASEKMENDQVVEQQAKSSASSSWIAAVAKPAAPQPAAPVVPPSSAQQAQPKKTATPKSGAPSAKSGKGPQQQQQQQQQQQKKGVASDAGRNQLQSEMEAPKPAAERPKRGWEKVAPKVVSEIVDDVVGESVSIATGSTQENTESNQQAPAMMAPTSSEGPVENAVPNGDGAKAEQTQQRGGAATTTTTTTSSSSSPNSSEEDKALLKNAFGAWGQKKSFVDIIKTGQPVGTSVPSSSGEDSAAAQAGNHHMETGKEKRKDSQGVSVTSLEGNWRNRTGSSSNKNARKPSTANK